MVFNVFSLVLPVSLTNVSVIICLMMFYFFLCCCFGFFVCGTHTHTHTHPTHSKRRIEKLHPIFIKQGTGTFYGTT